MPRTPSKYRSLCYLKLSAAWNTEPVLTARIYMVRDGTYSQLKTISTVPTPNPKHRAHLLVLVVVAVDGNERGDLCAARINLAQVHAVLVGVQGAKQAQQAQGLLPDGGPLLCAQKVEEVHEELGMLVVGLHHAARGLHQLAQGPQGQLPLLGGGGVRQELQQDG